MIELLHGKNSMLALAAARQLAADRTKMALIMGEIKASKGIRQAAILLAFLQSAKPVNGRIFDIGGSLIAAIGDARRPEDLRGFALAASCAGKSREETADDVLMGIAHPSSLENLTVAERLQPILIRRVRDMLVEVDPELSDAYVARLVGLGGSEKRGSETRIRAAKKKRFQPPLSRSRRKKKKDSPPGKRSFSSSACRSAVASFRRSDWTRSRFAEAGGSPRTSRVKLLAAMSKNIS